MNSLCMDFPTEPSVRTSFSNFFFSSFAFARCYFAWSRYGFFLFLPRFSFSCFPAFTGLDGVRFPGSLYSYSICGLRAGSGSGLGVLCFLGLGSVWSRIVHIPLSKDSNSSSGFLSLLSLTSAYSLLISFGLSFCIHLVSGGYDPGREMVGVTGGVGAESVVLRVAFHV